MTEQQYNELLQAIGKETMANMIKAAICQQFPEPLASQYCQQFDEAKNIADFLEFVAKHIRN